jgi:hypothetical protein
LLSKFQIFPSQEVLPVTTGVIPETTEAPLGTVFPSVRTKRPKSVFQQTQSKNQKGGKGGRW